MKKKTLAIRESTLTLNGANLKIIYPKAVREAAELRGGDKLQHRVVVFGKRKLIISERVSEDLSQEHEEFFDLLKD